MVRVDVAILGGGPASWALSASLAPAGLSVTLVSPTRLSPWTNTYGCWVDQLEVSGTALLDGQSPWAATFDNVLVIGDRTQTAERAYGLLDNARLADILRRQAESGPGLFRERQGTVSAVEHGPTGSLVRVANGKPIEAALVVDATGGASKFIQRSPAKRSPASQVAFGILAECDRPPLPENTCTHMDWRGPDRKVPSFAYVLPLADGWLIEETSLASRVRLTFEELESRLHARLRADGVEVKRVVRTERVSIPMDSPIPLRSQRCVGFGAAASLVHPATGYSIAASLRLAPRVAATIAAELGRAGADPAAAADKAWKVVWSDDRMKARRLEQYGLDRLLTMDQRELRSFFDLFFQLPPAVAATYLGGESTSGDLAGVMWKVFRNASPRIQRRLATGNPFTLVQRLLG